MRLSLREATRDDWARLAFWRNDPQTRAHSKQKDEVTLQRHWDWLRETLDGGRAVRLFVVSDTEMDRGPIGTGRIDWAGGSAQQGPRRAELSLTVDPRWRGQRYASQVVRLLVDQAVAGGALRLVAIIHEANVPSLRAFAAEGFRPTKFRDRGMVELELEGGK